MGDEGESDQVREWLGRVSKYKVEVVLVGMGLVLLMVGVKMWWSGRAPVDTVEIVSGDEKSEEVEGDGVVVDVAGAVERPGVYRLEGDARVGEAIERAGGLVEEADLAAISKSVNLAGKVSDGMKVYVPFVGDPSASLGQGGSVIGGGVVGGVGVVNVNTASASELDSLWGVGEARAQAIIANRPYADVNELQSKAGIPKNVIEQNEGKIGF